MILEKGHQWMGSILTQDASVQATQVSHIYTFVAMIITAIIIVISKTITTIYWLYHKAYQCMHHKLQHSEIISKYSTTKKHLIFLHMFALPYDLHCSSRSFFRSCSALAFRLLSKACSWFCGLAKVTATFLVWIWDPQSNSQWVGRLIGPQVFFGLKKWCIKRDEEKHNGDLFSQMLRCFTSRWF